jgi:hypothetical protein
MAAVSKDAPDRVDTLPVPDSLWNEQLFVQYRQYVRSGEPLETLDTMVRRVTGIAGYVSVLT